MATKEDLVNNIKDWMQIDKEIKILQKEIKDRREKKKKLTNSLVDVMKGNDIDCFDLSEGKIIYTKNKVKTPLNKKYLMSSLNKYFENNPNIKAEEVSNFIMENRGTQVKEGIRHKELK